MLKYFEIKKAFRASDSLIGTLRKTRRQLQRERQQTKALMSRTMAMHVRYNS